MEKVLIVHYSKMAPGGIETFLSYVMRYSLDHGIRVIWITSSRHYPLASYKDVVDYSKVETIIQHPWKIHFMIKPKISVTAESDVVMLSTTPLGYICFEQYRDLLKNKSIQHFLLLPHFEGKLLFPDQCFKSKFLKRYVYMFVAASVKKIDENDGLRAFNRKHLDTYEKYFHFRITEKDRKLLPAVKPDIEILEAEIEERAKTRRTEFKIITCSRFEFPHKGYLLGLLKQYRYLKEKYPKVSLNIIGYGDGKNEMDKVIATFPKDIADSISFTGMLSHVQMVEQIRKSHLFIGLAGSTADAARSAVPTLIVRHYSYSCETYGFYSDAYSKNLSTEPGEELLTYIEKVIMMNDSDYIELSKRQKNLVSSLRPYNPGYVFEQKPQRTVFSKKEIRQAYLINGIYELKHCLNRLYSGIKEHFEKS